MSEDNSVHPKACPICGVASSYVYRVEEADGKTASWFRCQCGVCFQENVPSHAGYDEKYATDYSNMKAGDLRLVHHAKTYAPIIEELTYGRQMLDVGYCIPNNMKFFEERGWITYGIDVNKDIGGKKNLYRGDFTTFDFDIPATTDELKAIAGGDKFERKFDLIWMNHSFEHFNDPITVLKKSYDLLSETGVIYIGTPDIDFVNKTGVAGYAHFKKDEHYVLWNERSLCRELERVGFNIVMKRRNFSSRYSSWYDCHIIGQKNYF